MTWPGDLSTQVTGYLVPASDWNDIVNAINHLGDDHDHYTAQVAGGGAALEGGVLYSTSTEVSLDTSEKTVMSYTIAQDALGTDNQIEFTGEFNTSGNDAHILRVKLAGSTVATITETSTGSGTSKRPVIVIRNNSSVAAQYISAHMNNGTGNGAYGTDTQDNSVGSILVTITIQLASGTGTFYQGRALGYYTASTPT